MSAPARRSEAAAAPAALAAFEARSAARDGSRAPGPSTWLHAARRDAFARFARRGIPTTRDEAFRATSLAPLAATAWGAPSPVAAEALTAERLAALGLPDPEGPRLVFVDGFLARRASRIPHASGGLVVSGLAEAAGGERARLEPILAPILAPAPPQGGHPLRDLCEALWDDGCFASVAPGAAPDGTLHVVSLSSGVASPGFHLRGVVLLGARSRLRLLETHASLGAGAAFANALVDVVVAPGARLDHARLEAEGGDVVHVGSLRARLGRDAVLASVALTFGGRLARVETDVTLEGEGAECDLDGAYAGGGARHLDHQTFVDHATPHGTSRQTQVGLLGGRARGVFNGRVIVRPDAQRTDARQTNRNLLLSPEALVDTRPELEIHADDVKCAHGATIGRLRDDALFYLRSRGLSLGEARRLLTEAFAVSILDRLHVPGLRAFAEERLRAVAQEAGGEGAP